MWEVLFLWRTDSGRVALLPRRRRRAAFKGSTVDQRSSLLPLSKKVQGSNGVRGIQRHAHYATFDLKEQSPLVKSSFEPKQARVLLRYSEALHPHPSLYFTLGLSSRGTYSALLTVAQPRRPNVAALVSASVRGNHGFLENFD
ncbi:uncharacterized protein ACB058_003829 [Synchiropus picturatus]